MFFENILNQDSKTRTYNEKPRWFAWLMIGFNLELVKHVHTPIHGGFVGVATD